MDGDEYSSVSDRQKASQARVHTELTETCRERIAQITLNPLRLQLSDVHGYGGIPESLIERAISGTYEDVGYSIQDYVTSSHKNEFTSHRNIVEQADTLEALSYVENLLEHINKSSLRDWEDIGVPGGSVGRKQEEIRLRVERTAEKVNVALETEGVLWKINVCEDSFDFQPVGSELMQDADNELSVVAQGKKWKSVISPYNAAYDLYVDRTYGYEIPEKLYNSIEELARTICVDEENWEENRELNLSEYLDTMREKNLFAPNNIMQSELGELSRAMERTFQKAGAERKNRHVEIDREYATLLLHQVSAYLTYIIRQYREKYGEDS